MQALDQIIPGCGMANDALLMTRECVSKFFVTFAYCVSIQVPTMVTLFHSMLFV